VSSWLDHFGLADAGDLCTGVAFPAGMSCSVRAVGGWGEAGSKRRRGPTSHINPDEPAGCHSPIGLKASAR
jgi:hypothetical protein